jgi:hypothetical protein
LANFLCIYIFFDLFRLFFRQFGENVFRL